MGNAVKPSSLGVCFKSQDVLLQTTQLYKTVSCSCDLKILVAQQKMCTQDNHQKEQYAVQHSPLHFNNNELPWKKTLQFKLVKF